ncbi:Fe-S cluster assembly sulfur transfer protein SufU [Patescibacteria group bacterium]
MDIYQEEILEHYRHPHNHGKIEGADVTQTEQNSSCGDRLTFSLKITDGKVAEIKFEGDGCAISQAAASMLTDEVIGLTVAELKKLQKEDVLELLGLDDLGPTRLRCALLPLQAITNAAAKL